MDTCTKAGALDGAHDSQGDLQFPLHECAVVFGGGAGEIAEHLDQTVFICGRIILLDLLVDAVAESFDLIGLAGDLDPALFALNGKMAGAVGVLGSCKHADEILVL